MKNIIILGNDSELLDLSLEKLYNKNCIIAGVNRAPYIINLDYLFFLDNILIKEFDNFNLKNTTIITTNYNIKKQIDDYNEKLITEKCFKHFHINDDLTSKEIFGSIPCLMVALKEYIYKDDNITFYLLGSSFMITNEISHFWKNIKYKKFNIEYNKDHSWYIPRYSNIIKSIKFLKRNKKYNIISCHLYNKRLKFLPNISFDNLLTIIQ